MLERRFVRSRRAITPIVAVLLLVAMSIVLSGVVYLWLTRTMQRTSEPNLDYPDASFIATDAEDHVDDYHRTTNLPSWSSRTGL